MSEEETFLLRRGWHKLVPDTVPQVYTNEYAALSVMVAGSKEEVDNNWTRWQETLYHSRKNSQVGRQKDLYLIIILESDDLQPFVELQSIADDTHVSRKLIMPKKENSICATLDELPLFGILRSSANPQDSGDQATESGLNEDLIADLAKKGAGTIFDNLIAGSYVNRDET